MDFMPLITSGFYFREAYILSKRRKTTEDLGPLKKEIGLIKEDLSNKITKFYASNQGETHLADSDNGKIMDMMLYGKSSQFTTTGKNLANGQNINCFINSVADTCGISSNDIGMVIDVSKLTNVSISTRSIQDRYRFACANTVPTRGNPITCYNGTSKDGTKDSYTMDTTGYNYLFINATKLEDIQVEKGSESTSYEPYTGGIPSPNPSYPQEIKSVVNPIVKVYGKNMMPYPKDNTVSVNGVTLTVKDGKYTLVGKPTAKTWLNIYPQVLDSTSNNMLSEKPLPTKGKNISMINGSEGYALNFRKVSNGDKVFGIEHNDAKLADEDSNGVFLYIYNIDKTYNDTFEIMISDPADTTSTVFEPYTEQEVSLPYTLNAIPVNSGGNVTIDGQQYIADYVDVERGKLVKRVYEYVFSGKERWAAAVDGAQYLTWRVGDKPGIIDSIYDKKCICSCLIANILSATRKGENYISTQSLDDTCRVWVSANVATSKLTGEKVFLALIVPEEISLTQEEIRAFKELAAYYPVTNVNVASEQLNGYTVFNYPVSMENGWNYVKQQLNDNRDYIYDMDLQSTEAYVNSEYAVALTELEV